MGPRAASSWRFREPMFGVLICGSGSLRSLFHCEEEKLQLDIVESVLPHDQSSLGSVPETKSCPRSDPGVSVGRALSVSDGVVVGGGSEGDWPWVTHKLPGCRRNFDARAHIFPRSPPAPGCPPLEAPLNISHHLPSQRWVHRCCDPICCHNWACSGGRVQGN